MRRSSSTSAFAPAAAVATRSGSSSADCGSDGHRLEGGPAPIDGQPVLVDTSVLIDGRIVDVAAAGFVPGRLLIPGFVLEELQRVADSADPFRRQKGRRGLGVVDALQKADDVVCELVDLDFPGTPDVDARLVKLARARGASLMTQDYNLNRLAQIEGVRVLNLNDLANAVKPIVGAGESMAITIVKEGKEPHQGVGYFEDGTMVVVENGRSHVDETVTVTVTTVLQTTAGRMIFATLADGRFDQASGAAAGSRQGRAALTSALIVPAFGLGMRAGEDKLWAVVAGRPVLAITLESIAAAGCFDLIAIAAPVARWEAIRAIAAEHGLTERRAPRGRRAPPGQRRRGDRSLRGPRLDLRA